MPAYFSMTLQFEKKRLHPHFVKNIYASIIKCGFAFKSGYWYHEDASLEEITAWNQERLEQNFELGMSQHGKHDYMQAVFDADIFSEFRTFWMCPESEIFFEIIIPEDEILDEQGRMFAYNMEKIYPIKALAQELWSSCGVDAIQTSLEESGGAYELDAVKLGKEVILAPFAIIKTEDFAMFPQSYFKDEEISMIQNDGVLVEKRPMDGIVYVF